MLYVVVGGLYHVGDTKPYIQEHQHSMAILVNVRTGMQIKLQVLCRMIGWRT